jgi:hypothetical protein
MLLQSHWLLTGPVAVKKVACKHSTLWRLLMGSAGHACSEASWHARYCAMHVGTHDECVSWCEVGVLRPQCLMMNVSADVKLVFLGHSAQ